MNVSIRHDQAKGAGYGIIQVTLDPANADAPPADARFLILAPGLGILGPEGWTDSEYRHQADAVEHSGNILTMRVGPAVVDFLSSGRTYFFRLAESPQRMPLAVEPGLLPSPRESRLSGVSAAPTRAETPKAAAPVPPVQPVPQPEPRLPRIETPKAAPARKSRLPLIIGLIIPALLIAGAVWWFLRDAGAPAPAPAAGSTISSARALQEARTLLQRHAPDEDLRAAVTRFSGQRGGEDAAFLLIEELAPRDPAMRLRYAAYFDPTNAAPSGSIQKDPEAARRAYRRAQDAGALEATKALDRLKQWAEREAAKGNAAARALLDNW